MIWAQNEDNPDYKLVIINAANDGFQSKLNSIYGSYVITQFTRKLEENIKEKNNQKFLNEILEDVQEDLHQKGKQLMVKTFNNKTEYIKFGKCRGDKNKSPLPMSVTDKNRIIEMEIMMNEMDDIQLQYQQSTHL